MTPISIHALREEGDYSGAPTLSQEWLFLSTPSARRATVRRPAPAVHSSISIHALREEGDATLAASTARVADFYPRPPRGGRHTKVLQAQKTKKFLSTPSARRATKALQDAYFAHAISIHALREEGDHLEELLRKKYRISIHALREEGDLYSVPGLTKM